MNISVVICTHNPREHYLRRVLEALQQQTLPKQNWELLLVDNASAKPLAPAWDLAWHPAARHVREESIGLTHARLRGIAEARHELLVFVDDDNLLHRDYLQAASKIAADYPQLGAWGGSCLPEYEAEPPADLRPWLIGLVVEKISTPIWARLPKATEACPVGAGLVLRRQQALYYRDLALNDPLRKQLGRSGKNLGAGEDTDMALSGFDLGFGVGRFPQLELTHLIPAARLTLDYFTGLYEGFGYSGTILETIYTHQNSNFPGRIQAGRLRILLQRILLLALRKKPAERKIRLAMETGRLRARNELIRAGHFQKRPSGS